MKYHINSKHECGKQMFSNIKLTTIFLDDTDDGIVSLINKCSCIRTLVVTSTVVQPQYS